MKHFNFKPDEIKSLTVGYISNIVNQGKDSDAPVALTMEQAKRYAELYRQRLMK